MSGQITAPKIRSMKAAGERIACVTAYDYTSGLIADASGADLVLVGDSVGNVCLGYGTTVPVELSDMVYHTKAVSKAVKHALLVADLPFGSYQASVEQAVQSAVALMKAGANAVKLEGSYVEAIGAISKAGIPVMGHVGFTPQSVNLFGGFKVQGRDNGLTILSDAQAIDQAGVFAMVLELMPSTLAKEITSKVDCPTIGIGAGIHCDGEVQVFHDVLGLSQHKFKHSKSYVEGFELFCSGLKSYVSEVKSGQFPTEEQSF